MKKRLLSALLALAMVVSAFVCVPFSVAAAAEIPEGSFISDTGFALGTYSLKGKYTGTAADPIEISCDITIPDLETFTGGTIGWGASELMLVGISHWRDLAVMIQYDAGAINYRDGGAYVGTGFGYAEGTAHYRLTIDTSSQTYCAWYTEPGGEEVQIANNAAFRSDTAKKGNIGVVNMNHSGTSSPFYISNHYINDMLVPDPNDVPVEREPVVLSVGPGHPYATPAAAMADAQEGDIIEIDAAGTYYGENALLPISKKNITIRGINGTPKMEVPNDVVVGGKGIWLISQGAENITIENIHFYGANGSGSNLTNAAGIRLDAGMTNVGGEFKFINCKFEHCNNGLLGGAERLDMNESYGVRFEHCEFYDLGHLGNQSVDPGYTHGIYVGNATQLIYRYNYSHEQNEGHLMKSRAQNSFIEYNFVSDGPTDGNTGTSANIDFANGGNVYVVGNILEKGAENRGGVNHYIIKYGHERNESTGENVNRGTELYVVNNTLVSNRVAGQHKAKFISGVASAKITAINNIFAGYGEMEYRTSNVTEKNNIFVTDPAAFFADAANYDYRLTPGSTLAIDAGTSEIPVVTLSAESANLMGTATYSLVPTKQYTYRDAEARPVDDELDIGAYEFVKLPGVEVDPVFGKVEFEDLAVIPSEDGAVGVTGNGAASKGNYSRLNGGRSATYELGKVQAANTIGLAYSKQGNLAKMELWVNDVKVQELPLANTNSYNDPSFTYTEFKVDLKANDKVELKAINTEGVALCLDYLVLKNVPYDDANYVKVEAENYVEDTENYKLSFIIGERANAKNENPTFQLGKREMNNPEHGVVEGAPQKVLEFPEVLSGSKYLTTCPFSPYNYDNVRNGDATWCRDRFLVFEDIVVPEAGLYNLRIGMRLTNQVSFKVYWKMANADDSTYQEVTTLDQSNNVHKYGHVTDSNGAVLLDYGNVNLFAGEVVLKVEYLQRLNGNPNNGMKTDFDYFELAPASNLAAPVAVSDLDVNVAGDTANLSWTAPEYVGSYDVRYSPYPITEENWKGAQKIVVSDMVEAGQTQTASVSGLNAKTKYYFAMKWSNVDKVVSPTSNVVTVVTSDTIAPAKVVLNSEALGLSKDTVKLTWRAVGDDGVIGAAASYELRYSTAPITAENFAQATEVSGVPANLAANTFLTVSVENLSENSKYYFAILAKDAAGNVSELSDVVEVTTKAAEAPAKVVNLIASPVTSDTIRLTWIAVGDDKFAGTAGSYDLRMSEEPITDANFEAATQLNMSAPQVSGSEESFDVSGLDQTTTYYFALKVISRDGRFVSELSNVASAHPYANKDALKAALADAQLKAEANYTEDSWAVFAEKLAAAIVVNNNIKASVDEVAVATNELVEAMNALQYKDVAAVKASLTGANVVFYPANVVFKVNLTPVTRMNAMTVSFAYDATALEFVEMTSAYEKLEIVYCNVNEAAGTINALLSVKGTHITVEEAADFVSLTFVPVDPQAITGENGEEPTPLETSVSLTHFVASGMNDSSIGVQFVSEIEESTVDVTVQSKETFDVTGDGIVDMGDLSMILFHFNATGEDIPAGCDLVDDDIVDVADILSMIAVIRYFNPGLLPA